MTLPRTIGRAATAFAVMTVLAVTVAARAETAPFEQ